MSKFQGGSAYAMARQIADGFLLVTERHFKRLAPPDLDKLGFEIDKLLREIRGELPPEEVLEIQKRNRRIQRLSSCTMMLRSYRQRFRR